MAELWFFTLVTSLFMGTCLKPSQQIRDLNPVFVEWWVNFTYGGPTIKPTLDEHLVCARLSPSTFMVPYFILFALAFRIICMIIIWARVYKM